MLREPPPPVKMDASGIDTSLIDAALRLTVTERIRKNDRGLETVRALQTAFAKYRDGIAASRSD